MTIINVPIIINGVARYPGEIGTADSHVLKYESGVTLRMPIFRVEDLAAIHAQADELDQELASLKASDIIAFLGTVGEKWDARSVHGRMFVRKYAHLVTQFSDIMVEGDYATFGHFMMQRFHLYDQLESEFGSDRILDEWLPVQMGYRRAFPRGLALHYLVGNIPLASMYSMVRSVVTKNRTIAKLPTRDPVSPVGLALAIIETDPQHPVSRSLSLAYWPHDDEVGDSCINSVDAACVWGGEEAVRAVKHKLPAGVPLGEYGPKWSVSAIDLDACEADDAAMRVVDDCFYYDQEACFNTQRVFVKGNVEKFIPALKRAAEQFTNNLPFVSTNRDIIAHRSIAGREALFLGWQVERGEDWMILVGPADKMNFTHPLARTIVVHPVKDLGEITAQLNSKSQTLSVFPWDAALQHRDAWAVAGTDRIVELGWSRMPRAGFTHDGVHGMHNFVRLVSMDRPWGDAGKYYTRRPNLEQYWFVKKYPHVRALMDKDEI